MKGKLAIFLGLIAVISFPVIVFGQAYNTSFVTAITYQNVSTTAAAGIQISFYAAPSTTSPIIVTQDALGAGASTSLYLGSVSSVTSPFAGSAVISSDQPLVATLVQTPSGSGPVWNRPLTSGFSAGGTTALLATVLKYKYGTVSKFSVQNIDSTVRTVTIQFINLDASTKYTATQEIQPGASYWVDMATYAGIADASWEGSVRITSAGNVVASALEFGYAGSTVPNKTYGFESIDQGSTKLYMPSAICDVYGQRSAYAVQNTSTTTSTNVTATYTGTNPAPFSHTQTQTVGPGAKATFIGCTASSNAAFYGSATLESTASVPIVAIGKVYTPTDYTTAFIGSAAGAVKSALPYVRWASNADWAAGTVQRTYIAIQNVGTAAAAGVTVKYIDKTGTVQGTHTIASIGAGIKVNSYATDGGLSQFGYSGSVYGGGAIIEGPAGSQLAVIARVCTNKAPMVCEDYNGTAVN